MNRRSFLRAFLVISLVLPQLALAQSATYRRVVVPLEAYGANAIITPPSGSIALNINGVAYLDYITTDPAPEVAECVSEMSAGVVTLVKGDASACSALPHVFAGWELPAP